MATEREAVVVLGMHRSGTSAMAGIAGALGAAGPSDPLPTAPENPTGFWESEAVMKLNDRVLHTVGSDWSDWRAIPDGALSSSPVVALAQEAVSVLRASFDDAPLIVLKDPRISRIYPVWKRVLEESGRRSYNVLMVRSPLEVAASLASRNGFSIERGLLIWLRYSLSMEAQSRGSNRSTVLWEDLRRNWRRETSRVQSETGLIWPNTSDAKAVEIDRFLSEEFHRHRSTDAALGIDSRVHSLVMRAFLALRELASQPQSNAARQELDEVTRLFNDGGRLFGPVMAQGQADLEQASLQVQSSAEVTLTLSARLREIESEQDLLRTERDSLHGRVVQLEHELHQTAGGAAAYAERISHLEAELAALNARADAVAADRDRLLGELAASVAGAGLLQAERDQARVERGDVLARNVVLEAVRVQVVAERDAAFAEAGALEAERERARIEHDQLLERADALEVARDQATSERDALIGRADALELERAQALVQVDVVTGRAAVLEAERNEALGERDALVEQADALEAERKQALAERDAFVEQAGAFEAERDRALAERDAFVEHADALEAERKQALAERDAFIERAGAFEAERDRAIIERGAFAERASALEVERNQATLERDAARERAGAVEAERDRGRLEASDILVRARALEAERDRAVRTAERLATRIAALERNLAASSKKAGEIDALTKRAHEAEQAHAAASERETLLEASLRQVRSELESTQVMLDRAEVAAKEAHQTAELAKIQSKAALKRLGAIEKGWVFRITRLLGGNTEAG